MKIPVVDYAFHSLAFSGVYLNKFASWYHNYDTKAIETTIFHKNAG